MKGNLPPLEYILQNLWLQQYVTISLLLISLAVGILRYNKLADAERIIFWQIVLGLVTELLSIFVGFFLNLSNNYVYNPFVIISISLYLLYYKKLNIGLPFWPMFSILLISSMGLYLYEGWEYLSKYTFLIGSVLVLFCVLFYFTYLLREKKVFNLFSTPSFLVSCGVLIYYVGVLPLVFFMEYIDFSVELNDTVLVLLNFIINFFFIKAFLCSNRANF